MLRPSGVQSAVDAKVVDYYQRWKTAFVRQNCGNGWYQVISPDADHPYVAEAQGYGMVIAATMVGADPDAKKIFDGLVKWKIDHPSAVNPDLLAAEQDVNCRSVNGGDGATDGDMDVAYGLLLADRQWGMRHLQLQATGDPAHQRDQEGRDQPVDQPAEARRLDQLRRRVLLHLPYVGLDDRPLPGLPDGHR